jgi:ABC-type glycerol-3-phosphate transport system substrate-binding protein
MPGDAQATTDFSTGRTLSLWVPPDFSPDGPSQASALLADRLIRFEASHPDVRIEVRVKGRTGPAGLMETLASASQAAPSILPDLVALDASELVQAEARELILPWQDAGTTPEDWGWTESILQGARTEGKLVGLPFAAQGDVFAYDPQAYPAPPRSWTDLLTANAAFILPLGDPLATFTLAQYLSVGGTLHGADGAPALDRDALQEVLTFYAAARSGGLLPLSSRQHETSSTTGAALFAGQIDAALVPFTSFAAEQAVDAETVGLWPTRDGQGTCFLLAWTWAVVSRPATPDPLAVELALWLAQPEFTGPWTRALGLLPPGSSALASWPADGLDSLAGALGASCLPLPPPADLALFGPVLREAAEATLTGELAPEPAAARAANALPGS